MENVVGPASEPRFGRDLGREQTNPAPSIRAGLGYQLSELRQMHKKLLNVAGMIASKLSLLSKPGDAEEAPGRQPLPKEPQSIAVQELAAMVREVEATVVMLQSLHNRLDV